MNAPRHIPELDGVRGLAVLIIMVYHFKFVERSSSLYIDKLYNRVLELGWISVDLFFVLSGFLITGILLDKKKTRYFFTSFYYRRALRIFPLYYLFLFMMFGIVFPFLIHHADPFEAEKVRYAQSLNGWFWIYLANVKQAIAGRFVLAGVGHLWSLAIEEQFYMMWPVLVYFTTKTSLRNISIGLIIFSLVTRLYLKFVAGWGIDAIFLFTPARLDTLSFGCLAAIAVRSEVKINYRLMNYVFYLLVGVAVVFYAVHGLKYSDAEKPTFMLSYTLSGMMFGVLILMLQSSYPVFYRGLFVNKFLLFLGKYSYALYMFHPIIRFVMAKLLGKPVMVHGSEVPWIIGFTLICIAISIIISQISWHLYEKQFLKLKDRFFKA
ncbi:acyltransferase family protein [Hufsiella ginkgonis]|uniref:Acyltransferase family protein n=1 Tax=Hufsiella ginkgonis TaxID=2695274 RepID=A0A7K1Y2W7_9SPHI|nr:acyltransferase [Hufsiella ginkgonis]MXV17438.1 acyltransferase family protein [Hufsiella ginkgonis]